MGSKTKSKKLTKKQKAELELLRLKQDPAFFLKERLKGLRIKERVDSFLGSLNMDDVITTAVALYGAWAFKHPYGALWGAIGYKLARSPNTLAAGSGLTTLAILGLAGIPSEVWESMYDASLPKKPDWWPFEYPEGWPRFR
jgi:hypothetical protein